MNWQPIETAPKDGTFVLLGGGTFNDDELSDPIEIPVVGRFCETRRGHKFWIVAALECGFNCLVYEPTHWMPLPAKPSAEPITILPDGSGFFTASLPLPKDHWLTQPGENIPPMVMRMPAGFHRDMFDQAVTLAAKYAIRAATMNGQEKDFDPDALVQNLIVGLRGACTPDGLFSDPAMNPNPIPPMSDVECRRVDE